MLVASMNTPWLILDQLRFWAKAFADHVDQLATDNHEFKEILQKCRQQSKIVNKGIFIKILILKCFC